MKSNQLNIIDGRDPINDQLKKLGNRIKTLRIKSGHLNYERFAYENNIGRLLLRRCELGSNLTYKNLLKVTNALKVTLEEFFSEGFD